MFIIGAQMHNSEAKILVLYSVWADLKIKIRWASIFINETCQEKDKNKNRSHTLKQKLYYIVQFSKNISHFCKYK